MAMGQKMYPPIIPGTIPAFYADEGGTAILTVPFSISRAVSANQIGGLVIKIKTVQGNSLIKTLSIERSNNSAGEVRNAINTGLAHFTWTNLNFGDENNPPPIDIGQYLKIQMAFKDMNDVVGYFSTVGVTKVTDKPSIAIKDAAANLTVASATPFKQTYTGIYKMNEDLNERPNAYCFLLYNSHKELIENSGWLIHNASVNDIFKEAVLPDETSDTYTYKTTLEEDLVYYIQYGIRTINNLEIFSPLYQVADVRTLETQTDAELIAVNNFDNGYIELFFNTSKTGDIANGQGVSIAVYRSSKEHSYNDWQLIQKFYCVNYMSLSNWHFKDFAIEQGQNYQYSFREYNESYMFSVRKVSNIVLADFEDMFLWDGERQLKLRFNPKITSFKTTQAEQKLETIGGKFPFIFKNGNIGYKEFPISGLVSYWMDSDQLFVNLYSYLGLTELIDYGRRKAAGTINYNTDIYVNQNSLSAENISAERKFKLEVLDWLNNGKNKVFKSPAEGNYIVRLMNVSMSPEDKLSRMLHTVQATAYEMAEFNYDNLLKLNFLDPSETTETTRQFSSFSIKERINTVWTENYNPNVSIKLNAYEILSYLNIHPAKASDSSFFYVRIGSDSATHIAAITTEFTLEDVSVKGLPMVYINYNDNKDLLKLNNDNNEYNAKDALMDLVGDSTITYNYYATEVPYGILYDIENVTLRNELRTFVGQGSNNNEDTLIINFGPEEIYTGHSTETQVNILSFLTLNFAKKDLSPLVLKRTNNNHFYSIYDENNITEITSFNELMYYKVVNANNVNQILGYYCSYDGVTLELLAENEQDIDCSVILTSSTPSAISPIIFNQPPVIDLVNTLATNDKINQIKIAGGAYLNAAYWVRTVSYNT